MQPLRKILRLCSAAFALNARRVGKDLRRRKMPSQEQIEIVLKAPVA